METLSVAGVCGHVSAKKTVFCERIRHFGFSQVQRHRWMSPAQINSFFLKALFLWHPHDKRSCCLRMHNLFNQSDHFFIVLKPAGG